MFRTENIDRALGRIENKLPKNSDWSMQISNKEPDPAK